MQICDKKRYGESIAKQLDKLEGMHDAFREQKEFCFTQMFTELGISCGQTIKVNLSLKFPTSNEKYEVHTIGWGIDEYVYLTAKNENGDELNIEPYYLDAYDDFDYVFGEVYDCLKAIQDKKKPSDKFALATYNYLVEECNFANANDVPIEMFCTELKGHNYNPIDLLPYFDVNIGAFCFSIMKKPQGYEVCNGFEIWDKDGNVEQGKIDEVKSRLS